MRTTFYATDADLLQIAQWFLEMPGMMLFEPSSRPGLPNRQFCHIDDVTNYFREPGRYIAAWLESSGARPLPHEIEFEPNTQRRFCAKGRTELRSPAMITIHRTNNQNGCLGAADITCWTEEGARQRSIYPRAILDQVDWKVSKSVVGHFKRKIIKASPAKLRSYPIMSHAFSEMREGRLSLWAWGTACAYPSPLITVM